MKFTLIILTVLAPFFAHAGGGGGLRPGMQTMMMKSPEIIFTLAESDEAVVFAHGQLIDNNWNINKVQIQKSTLSDDRLEDALKNSAKLGSWIQLK